MDNKKFRKFAKEINTKAELAFSRLSSPNEETQRAGVQMMEELHNVISLSGMSPAQQTSLRKSLRTKLESEWGTVSDALMKSDRHADQQRLGKVLGKF